MPELSTQTKTEDGEEVTRVIHVEDDHADSARETFHSLAAQAEKAADFKASLDETKEELSTTKELVIGEIVRRKKLSGEVGEDADFSESDEVEYLEGLPANRLQKEWERAMELGVDTDPATDPDADPPTNDGPGAYDGVAVEA